MIKRGINEQSKLGCSIILYTYTVRKCKISLVIIRIHCVSTSILLQQQRSMQGWHFTSFFSSGVLASSS